MKSIKTIFILGVAATLVATGVVTGIVLYRRKQKKEYMDKKIVLIGGLEHRPSDLKINKQVELVKKGIGDNKEVIGFSYFENAKAIEYIKNNPESYVIMFSAGCKHARAVAQKIKNENKTLDKIFIVEPYHVGGDTTKSVRDAVSLGVPEKNVIVGKYKEVGLGIVNGATPTPLCKPSHWCALTKIGKFIA